MASKLQNMHKALPTGPRRALIAPKWLLVGPVTQTNCIDVMTVFILIVFIIYRSSESNNLSFHQYCFANVSDPKIRMERVLYLKLVYGSQLSGGKNNLKI